MHLLLRILFAAAFILAATREARADRIVFTNGSWIEGKVTAELGEELLVTLSDGMLMRVPRSTVERIEPSRAPTPKPVPTAESEPAPEPETEAQPPPVVAPSSTSAPEPDLFENTPTTDWEFRYSRFPSLTAAKNTSFRAYRHVESTPLGLDPASPEVARAVRENGHGGRLAVRTFEYQGMNSLRFGDEVKFVAELTTPLTSNLGLIRLKLGPQAATDRLVVIMVRRGSVIRRFATTTVFETGDFRQTDVRALEDERFPVRTFTGNLAPISTHWMTEKESAFLDGLYSPFGESVRVRLARFEFRLAWFAREPRDRPPLDPALLAENAVRPLAAEGRPVATDEQVRKYWGTAATAEKHLKELRNSVRTALSRIGVLSGKSYFVESDMVGVFGRRGLTIRTRRYALPETFLSSLTAR